jgi:hypothetical protein
MDLPSAGLPTLPAPADAPPLQPSRPPRLHAFSAAAAGDCRVKVGYPLKAGQLTYDCSYSIMHGMPVTGSRGFRGLKPLWYNGVPP